jgi:hypothetical protein
VQVAGSLPGQLPTAIPTPALLGFTAAYLEFLDWGPTSSWAGALPHPRSPTFSPVLRLPAQVIGAAMLWGAGTALGEVPPYAIAYHTAKAGIKNAEVEAMLGVSSSSSPHGGSEGEPVPTSYPCLPVRRWVSGVASSGATPLPAQGFLIQLAPLA